jgi:hypothetical protein
VEGRYFNLVGKIDEAHEGIPNEVSMVGTITAWNQVKDTGRII